MNNLNQVYKMPTSGSWDKGHFYACVERLDGFHSGVYLDRTSGSSVLSDAQRKVVESATCIEELMKAPGAISSDVIFARYRSA